MSLPPVDTHHRRQELDQRGSERPQCIQLLLLVESSATRVHWLGVGDGAPGLRRAEELVGQ